MIYMEGSLLFSVFDKLPDECEGGIKLSFSSKIHDHFQVFLVIFFNLLQRSRKSLDKENIDSKYNLECF